MPNIHLHYYVIDAFTGRAFTGNPAAVVMIDEARSEAWMQQVAAEFNLAETAFIETLDNGDFRIRWFTPTTEVDLCGHATIAGACALWITDRAMKNEPITLISPRAGHLEANLDGSWIELDFPGDPTTDATPPIDAQSLVGVPVVNTAKGASDWVIEVESEDAVRAVVANVPAIAALDARGVIVTGPPTTMEGVDFVSRCFYPAVGIDEDPVTGSAHCTLAAYWGAKLDKTEMRGFQASPRGGIVRVALAKDRVNLAGQAILTMSGRIIA